MHWSEHIENYPPVRLKDSGLPVAEILKHLAAGHNTTQILETFPYISEYDVEACREYDSLLRARPTLQQYMRKVMSPFSRAQFQLTAKAQECMLRSIAAARSQNISPYDDSLMRGFIEAKSVAIPILDSAGINFRRFLDDLKTDPSGHDDHELDSFTEEYASIRSGQPFKVIQWAAAIAQSRGRRVIDSGVLLEGLFRQSLDANIRPLSQVKRLAAQPLTRQLHSAITKVSRDHVKPYQAMDFRTLLDQLAEDGAVETVSPLLEKLAVHVGNWRSIETIEDSLAFARNIEPYIDEPRHVIVPTSKGFRIRQFDYLNTYLMSEGGTVIPSKVNTFTGAGILSWEQIEQFEHLLNKRNVTESDFQTFFKRNPKFVLGENYRKLYSQITLLSDSGNELIPDFFAERIGSRFADVIEIKKPSARLVVGKPNRRGFSAELTQALNQAREYRNFFDDALNRKRFHNDHGFEAFRPRLCIIIGRSSDYVDYIERIRIEDEYKNLKVLTFDDILERAKQVAVIK